MDLTQTDTLQRELNSLTNTAKAAAGHPFLPAPARDAITQACFVMQLLGQHVLQGQPLARPFAAAADEPTSERPSDGESIAIAMHRLAGAIEADTEARAAAYAKTDKLIDLVYPRIASEFAALNS